MSKGGSQHQLEAMNAESNAPKLAKPSARPDDTSSPTAFCSVAHGDPAVAEDQQSGAEACVGFFSSSVMVGGRGGWNVGVLE